MSDGLKHCPVCSEVLGSSYRGALLTWECPQGHGVGVNILESYGRLQRDEIESIWVGAKEAPDSALLSPLSGRPMKTVTFTADDDTEYGNSGPGGEKITIELDSENYFGWFSFEELKAMPSDENKNGPAGPGFVGLDQLDRGEKPFDSLFDDAEDYAMDRSDVAETSNHLLSYVGGLSRRLRG